MHASGLDVPRYQETVPLSGEGHNFCWLAVPDSVSFFFFYISLPGPRALVVTLLQFWWLPDQHFLGLV